MIGRPTEEMEVIIVRSFSIVIFFDLLVRMKANRDFNNLQTDVARY